MSPNAQAASRGIPSLPANMGALTSLRALLAWWVVVFHLAPLAPFRLSQSIPLLHKGPVLVDCFFVLSGFVLYHVHPRILGGGNPRQAVADFLAARLARVYPTHLAMLGAFVLLIGGLHLTIGFRPADPNAFTLAGLAEQALLLHGWLFPTYETWNFPSWSVSSECVAYLLAPLLFRWIEAARPRAMLIAGLLVATLAIASMETGWPAPSPAWMVLRVTTEFLLGALLRVLAAFAMPTLLRLRAPALLFGWAAAMALAPCSHPGLFFAAMVWLMLFLSLTGGWGGIAGRTCRYLGETSYAVYMCHAFVLTIWAGVQSRFHLGPLAAPWPAFVLLCVAIQAGACLVHHTVEVPGGGPNRGGPPAGPAVRGGARHRFGRGRAILAANAQSGAPAPGTCAPVSPRISTT